MEKRAFCQILQVAAFDYRALISFGLFLEEYDRKGFCEVKIVQGWVSCMVVVFFCIAIMLLLLGHSLYLLGVTRYHYYFSSFCTQFCLAVWLWVCNRWQSMCHSPFCKKILECSRHKLSPSISARFFRDSVADKHSTSCTDNGICNGLIWWIVVDI